MIKAVNIIIKKWIIKLTYISEVGIQDLHHLTTKKGGRENGIRGETECILLKKPCTSPTS
jgi:hypothetical protein